MRRAGLSLPLLLSFNELAWICAFFIALYHLSEKQKYETDFVPTSEVAHLNEEVKRLASKLKISQDRNAQMRRELQERNAELVRLRRQITTKPAIPPEVFNLKGRFSRVVIVVDCSGSMGESGRWAEAIRVVKAWLQYLPMEQCALITFSTEAHCLQIGEQSLFPLDGPEGERDRGRLLDSLNRIVPEGGTNTLAALRMAYEIEGVDTILLFTDGEPNDGKSRGFDPENAAMIHELCRGKRGIPVNTVGVGAYSKRELFDFLLQVAEETGGTFIGR